MHLIYYQGLNCHLACIISIAAFLGVNYQDAFATLWSETDFTDDLEYNICISKRVFTNLEALGLKTDILNCASKKEKEESMGLVPDGDFFLVGMDTFHIPWSPVYQHFHSPHYFIAQKAKTAGYFCFDPTYDKKYVRIKSSRILNCAFDLGRIYRIAVEPVRFEVEQEAREILRSHPKIQKELRARIQKCRNKDRANMDSLIKQVTAMINNRHLFAHFLHQPAPNFNRYKQFFDKDFFSRWEAVRNGLYKTSIMKNNESVIDELCKLLLDLTREEMAMATEMIRMESDSGSFKTHTMPSS